MRVRAPFLVTSQEMLPTPSRLSFAFLLCLVPGFAAPNLPNPFFAYELGESPLVEQVRLASELGFDGMSFDDPKLVPERLSALDAVHRQLFFLWINLDISKQPLAYDPGLEPSIRALAGRGTVIWLALSGRGPQPEEAAIEASQHIADLAAASNLRVALYPHHGFYLPTLNDVMRVAEKAHRSNLGVTFNLCHEIRSGIKSDLYVSLEHAMPRLYAVTINGADRQGTDWDTLIQPLDRGDFDVPELVRRLVSIGYRGPIGLQCYGIKAPLRNHLPRSMKTWNAISSAVAKSEQSNDISHKPQPQ